MPVTQAQIISKMVSNHIAKSHSVVTSQTFDGDSGGVTDVPETVPYAVDPDMQVLLESLVDAILSEILLSGVEVGISTATQMDVGP